MQVHAKKEQKNCKIWQNGLFMILEVFSDTSEYVLDLSKTMNITNKFHDNFLSLHVPNNNILFPTRCLEMLRPIVTENEQEEHFIDCILDERRWGCRMQYLVHWQD